MDNLDDKLINVIVKYTVQGQDTAQTSSKKTKDTFMRDMDEMLSAFQKLRSEGIRTWEDLAKNMDKLDLSKVSDEFKQPFLEAAQTLANYESLYEQANPGKSGGPLDPQAPRKYGQELQTVEQGLQRLKSTARDLGEVGSFLAVSGGLITGPALLNASNYVKTLGEITPLTAEWLSYQRSLEQSNLRIGEATTQAILPAYRMTAEFMEKVASVVQQNPWLVQAAVYAGGAMVAIGGTMRIVSEITKVVAEIGLLLARLELNQAKAAANQFGGYGGGEYLPGGAGSLAGSQLGTLGTVTLLASCVIIGAELGEALGNYLGKTFYGDEWQQQNVGDALVTLIRIFQLPWALLASLLDKIDPSLKGVAQGLMEVLNNVQEFTGKLFGANQYKEPETNPLLDQNAMISQQMVEAYISFQKQLNAAQENYSAQRKDIIEQYERQIAESTERYQSQRADIINNYNEQSRRASENFARSQAQAQEAYERQRAQIISGAQEAERKAQASYQSSVQRAAQQHKLELQRMEQDHNARMWEAAANRDALALVKEQESYDTERSRKEQDYRIQEQQRREDFQRQQAEIRANAQQQLADLKANHERQRAEQRAEFQRQQAEAAAQLQKNLARLDESHKREMEKLASQEKEKLKKLDEGYKKQVDQIQTAFVDRLRSMDAAILGDTQAFTRYMQEQAVNFQNWLNQFKAQANAQLPSTTNAPQGALGIRVGAGAGRQWGGYASFMGPGETGSEEFVMSHATTRMAEALVGARLNQANLIQGIMAGKNVSGGSSSRSVQIIVQSRNLTLSEIRAQVDQVFNQRISDLLPAFGV